MDTFTEILKSLPLTALKCNAAGTAYFDITGRGVVLSATPTLTTPINAGATRAAYVGTTGVNFPSGVFIRGQERRGFTLEATVLPLDLVTDNMTILSHVSANDGLSFVGGNIRFTVEFNTTGSVYVEYKVPDNFEAMSLVGTYSPGAIKLYVNGEGVGTTEVSTAQVKDGFKTRANNNLYIGVTSGAKVALMDSFALYSRTLSDAEAYMHHLASTRVVPSVQATSSFKPIEFNGEGRNIYAIKEWAGEAFDDGQHNNTTVQTNLVPQIDYVTQLSKASTWIGTYEMPTSTEFANIYGVKVDWEGYGALTVATSINSGASWQTATNHQQVASTFGLVPAGTPILVRVTFTGGISGDTANISNLKVTAYIDQYLRSTDSGRTMTLVTGVSSSDVQEEPIMHHRYNGIHTASANPIINLDVDPDDPKNVAVFEAWVTFESTITGAYVFDARPGSTYYLWISSGVLTFPAGMTVYVNGAAVASGAYTMRLGVPVHIMAVFGTPFNAAISLSSWTRMYDFIKLYNVTVAAADAARIYNAYVAYPTSRLVTESNPVTEGGSAYKTYAYDWSITQAG